MASSDRRFKIDPHLAALKPKVAGDLRLNVSPEILKRLRPAPGAEGRPVTPQPTPAQPAPGPTPEVASAPSTNPLDELPFPSPGDPILAEHFRAISESLLLIRDALSLSGVLFGNTFEQVKRALVSQGYEIVRVMSVFGTEIDNLNEPTLDDRKVIHVGPVEVGEPEVMVVVTEVSETGRVTPNLVGLTYEEAQARVRTVLGDVPGAGPVEVPNLIGLTLHEAQEVLSNP